jgi:hypothetical protein
MPTAARRCRTQHRENVVQRLERLLRNGKRFVAGNELRTVVVRDADETADGREHRQHEQRQRHHRRRFVRVRGGFGFFLAEKTTKNKRNV